ncbi:hypothetical protein DFP98_101268 [Cohnella phaseoli]|uniref:Uncharacterized protein n=1 Tax=Cohnella phaseoli TaxID=456490 RepID=A0A3D9KRF5_9BACL|nr:hypothetical protein DFP98_101268 [Cohnella phaseoli]
MLSWPDAFRSLLDPESVLLYFFGKFSLNENALTLLRLWSGGQESALALLRLWNGDPKSVLTSAKLRSGGQKSASTLPRLWSGGQKSALALSESSVKAKDAKCPAAEVA